MNQRSRGGTPSAFGDTVALPSGSGGVSPHEIPERRSAASAEDHHATDHVEIEPVFNTSTPDSAMPAPTPPNPQPTRWSACRRWNSIALTANMKTRALAPPATKRRTNQAASSRVVGMSASVATDANNATRMTLVDRTRAGATM